MSWENNVYSNPEKHGLRFVAEIGDEAAAYTFDEIVVWQSLKNGKLYWATDSGCSCPLPFEGYTEICMLTPLGKISELEEFMAAESYVTRSAAARRDFIEKVRTARREWKAKP